MTTDVTTNFLGIPIEGEITRGSKRADQKPLAELEPLIRAVLDDPFIAKIGWTQYTPYFNDGEPCEFNVHEPWFRTVEDVAKTESDDEDDEDDDNFTMGYSGHPTLGERDYHWDNPSDYRNRRKVYEEYKGNHEASYDRCAALADAINSGAFENVLLEAFGDHAEITVRRDGITVDFYSHD